MYIDAVYIEVTYKRQLVQEVTEEVTENINF